MHPTRRTRIHPKGLQSPLEVMATPQRHRENKGSICRYNMLDSLLKASPLRARERGPQPSAWKGNSANFALTEFSEVQHSRVPLPGAFGTGRGCSLRSTEISL